VVGKGCVRVCVCVGGGGGGLVDRSVGWLVEWLDPSQQRRPRARVHPTSPFPPRLSKTHTHTIPQSQPTTSVVPDERGRKKFKIVYVVLESQYQSTLTAACTRINEKQDNVRI
jgi:hypothetical protein